MLSYLDHTRVARNMGNLAAVVAPGETGQSLKKRYFAALNKIQGLGYNVASLGETPLIEFGHQSQPARKALAVYETGIPIGSRPFIDIEFSAERRDAIANSIRNGMLIIRSYEESLPGITDMVVERFIITSVGDEFSGSAGQGDALGIVWLYPGARWGDLRFAESILHETIHQTLFAEEMCRTLYCVGPEVLLSEEAQIQTSINHLKRPYDLCFHSMCVSAVLIDMFRACGNVDMAADYLERARPTLGDISARKQYLSENGLRILAEVTALWHENEQRLSPVTT